MLEKNQFNLLLGLNAALALAFIAYLFITSTRHPDVVSTSFPQTNTTTQAGPDRPSWAQPHEATSTVTQAQATVESQNQTNRTGTVDNPEVALRKPVFTQKQYGWRDLTNDQYQVYLDSLRAVGCPEDKVRYIVMADIDELMAQRRLDISIQHDTPWWQVQPATQMVNVLQEKGRSLQQERNALLARWLGEEVEDTAQTEESLWSNVQLTGPILGKLDREAHKAVQEVCAESIDRYQTIFWSSINAGRTMNKLDLAKLREGTRSHLVKILDDKQLEEFLLRYSHNANNLRQELQGFNPTPEEFRKIFRATDPLDHAMQQRYGSLETMSPQQREKHQRLRDMAIKESLEPKRLAAFQLTKDPVYRQAQSLARTYGAPSTSVEKIYRQIQALEKSNQSRRDTIMKNTQLTPLQRQQALLAVKREEQMAVRRMVAQEAASNRARNKL